MFMIQLTFIVAFACNQSFETEIMPDCSLLVVIESVHIFLTLLNSVVSLALYRDDRPTRLPSMCFSLSVL